MNETTARAMRHLEHHGGRLPQSEAASNALTPTNGAVPVVYIAGAGRSGSTLLADILASIPGFSHAGELRYVWQRGFIEDRRCSCGDEFSTCEFWSDVRDHLPSHVAGDLDPAEVAGHIRANTRVRQLIRAIVRPDATKAAALKEVEDLYRAFQTVSQCGVIIDSSKLPPYARLIDRDPRFDVHIVHLVRDPRGVISSWGRVKANPDSPGAQMQQMSPLKASTLWLIWNSLTLLWWRRAPNYTQIRYEDLVSEPASTISHLLRSFGHGDVDFVLETPGQVEVGANYGIAGNPDRFQRSARKLRLDTRWKEDLTPWKKQLTTLISLPLLRSFRYPVRT